MLPFVVDAPPPSYDQALFGQSAPPPPHFNNAATAAGHSNPIASGITESGGAPLELCEKVAAQSELIREQEAEIGKLKRDLGRMREQMHQTAAASSSSSKKAVSAIGGAADKLTQHLAQAVDEEAEERRRKSRSRKGDILRGAICCVALLAVLLLGLYVVLSRPSPSSQQQPSPSMEQFRVIGKAMSDNLCWAQALIQPRGRTRSCHIFRRSLEDRQLFCEFHLNREENQQQKASWAYNSRRKGLIVLKDSPGNNGQDRKRAADYGDQKSVEDAPSSAPAHLLLHSLDEAEAREARRLCSDQIMPLLVRPARLLLGRRTRTALMVAAAQRQRGWRRLWGWH